jgi:hypothetical protein
MLPKLNLDKRLQGNGCISPFTHILTLVYLPLRLIFPHVYYDGEWEGQEKFLEGVIILETLEKKIAYLV